MTAMKKCVACLLALIAAFVPSAVCAQEKSQHSHNVYVELFGGSDFLSVNYDTRFSGSTIFGWRAGVGFSAMLFDSEDKWFTGEHHVGVSVPLGVNAIFGKHASKFEVGIRVTPGLYTWQDDYYWLEGSESGPNDWVVYSEADRKYQFGCSFGIDVGYRLQRPNGFNFRIGLSPNISVNAKCVSFSVLSAYPYISFGYTFR